MSLGAPGAEPEVRGIDTAQFSWRMLALDLLAGEDGEMALGALLPGAPERRQTLLRVALRGRTGLVGRSGLVTALEHLAPEFAHLEWDEDGLAIDSDASDLDRIDRAGALRDAADALLAESRDGARSAEERAVAAAALMRLFSYCDAVAP